MTPRRLRVVFLTASVSREAGGLFHSVRRLAQELASRGDVELDVLALEDRRTAADLPLWAPVPVRTFPRRRPLRFFGWNPRLTGELLRSRADVVHLHGLWLYPSLALSRWRRTTGGRAVVSPRGMLDPWAWNHARWKKRPAWLLWERANLEAVTCIHSLCPPETEAIRALGLRTPVHEIPNGVDLPSGSPPPPPWAGRVPPGDRVLLFLGRLHPKKGVRELLLGWSGAERSGAVTRNRWWLAIAGWGAKTYVGALKRLIRELELKRVLLCGPLFGDAKAGALAGATAFVLPSASEGLPVAVLEAWANGIPVLMTKECNLPEGFRLAAAIEVKREPAALASSLVSLVSMDSGGLRAMGLRGRRLVERRFLWEHVGASVYGMYRWTLGRRWGGRGTG